MILRDFSWKSNGFHRLPIALFVAIMFLALVPGHAQSGEKSEPHKYKTVEVIDTIVTFDPGTNKETIDIVKSDMRVYESVDVMPVYSLEGCEGIEDAKDRKSCGDKNLLNAVYTNINFPKGVKKEGMILLRFLIDKEGYMMNPEILRSFDKEFSGEVMKMFHKLQEHRWVPGQENGQPAATFFILPVKFKLEN